MQRQILKAFIDEENCIGCFKCQPICPTDAIVGSKRMLHTVIPALCTACEECINVCPTSCITLATLAPELDSQEELRLSNQKQMRLAHSRGTLPTIKLQVPIATKVDSQSERKQQVVDAIARVKMRKMQQK